MPSELTSINDEIIACRKCQSLRAWCEAVAIEKRAAYRHEVYWGQPVPSFGDEEAQNLIVGLAPAAHGANRTGRMFTGDRSGEWLYRALYKGGFASQASSVHVNDGLCLKNVRISAVVHCAPPQNKAKPQERDQCLPYLTREISALKNLKVILALGKFAWDGVRLALRALDERPAQAVSFAHGVSCQVGPYKLLASYHPSQQNTFTGRLTEKMLDEVIEQCQALLKK